MEHRGFLARLYSHRSSSFTRATVQVFLLLLLATLVTWGIALVAFASSPFLLGLASTAYLLGLRHALDADHLSAIDNVTRKLLQERRKPVTIGLFFALGHCTVVIVVCFLIMLTATALNAAEGTQAIGKLIGTGVSAFFLFAIAGVNLLTLRGMIARFRQITQGGSGHDHLPDDDLHHGGLFARLFRPFLRMTDRSWKMYPLGLLFGLGLDTAMEVGILCTSALLTVKGLSLWTLLLFPALFTVGMCLLDTADGILMIGAYGWAFVKPVRKIYYNLTMTLVSALVALVVAVVETLGIVQAQWQLEGGIWAIIAAMNENFGLIGYLIVGVFVLCWAVAALLYRLKRYDALSEKKDSVPVAAQKEVQPVLRVHELSYMRKQAESTHQACCVNSHASSGHIGIEKENCCGMHR